MTDDVNVPLPSGDTSYDFGCSVHIVNLARASLSRKYKDIRCSLACDGKPFCHDLTQTTSLIPILTL